MPSLRDVKRVGAALALAVTFSSAALAADPPTSLQVSYGIKDDGTGILLANPVPDGSWGALTWQACSPDGSCAATQPSKDSDRVLDVGDATPGTTFVATASDGERSFSATSVPYRGRLGAALLPGVIGSLRVGHVIRPVPGIWVGGWGEERPLLQLQVCRTRRDDSCEVISATFFWDKCPDTSARIAPRYLGWYVRVADERIGKDTVFAARAYLRPQDVPAAGSSPRTAVRTIGRIAPGRGPDRRC